MKTDEQIFNEIAEQNNCMSLSEIQRSDTSFYLTILLAMNQARIDTLTKAQKTIKNV